MKGSVKKLLSAALVLVMLIGVFAVSASAEPVKGPVYTVLGDSNASGYGLDAYFANAGSIYSIKEGYLIPGSYAAIFAEAIGASKVNVCSHCAWRTNEFLRVTVDDYVPDGEGDFYYRALSLVSVDEADRVANSIIPAIQESDVITVDFGSNDIYTHALMDAIYADYSDVEAALAKLKTDFSDLADAEALLALLADNAEFLGLIGGIVKTFEDHLDAYTEMYKQNIVQVISRIRELNPEAKIVMMGMFNPANIVIEKDGAPVFDLVSFMDYRVALINCYLRNECPVRDEYTFVDVTHTGTYGIGALDFDLLMAGDFNVLYSAVKMVHATESGHAYMAKQLIETFKSAYTAPVVRCNKSVFLKKNVLTWEYDGNAVCYRVYRSNTENGEYCYIGTTVDNVFYDAISLYSLPHYYKVCAVTNYSSNITSDMSAPVKG